MEISHLCALCKALCEANLTWWPNHVTASCAAQEPKKTLSQKLVMPDQLHRNNTESSFLLLEEVAPDCKMCRFKRI